MFLDSTTFKRIRESSAATTHCAAHQLAGSQHFETEPLQHGLTGDVTLPSLDAQFPKHTHTHTHHYSDNYSLTLNDMSHCCNVGLKECEAAN